VQTPKEQIVKHYRTYGRERCQDGFPLPEVIYSFHPLPASSVALHPPLRFLDTAYELLRALELNTGSSSSSNRALHSYDSGV